MGSPPSAFRLATGDATVFIDPFGDMSALAAGRGLRFDYPAIEGVQADLVLVTHEHRDHNEVQAIAGAPAVLRSTAGRPQRCDTTSLSEERGPLGVVPAAP
jgi:L-ascorbate metabolism protein UlaG (beta-lactamase superfamily)